MQLQVLIHWCGRVPINVVDAIQVSDLDVALLGTRYYCFGVTPPGPCVSVAAPPRVNYRRREPPKNIVIFINIFTNGYQLHSGRFKRFTWDNAIQSWKARARCDCEQPG